MTCQGTIGGGLALEQPIYQNISLVPSPAEISFWTWFCLDFSFFLLSFVFSCEGLPPTETHTCHASLLSFVCISHYKQHYVCRAQGWPTRTSQIVMPNGTFSWIPKIPVSAEGKDKRLGIKCFDLRAMLEGYLKL